MQCIRGKQEAQGKEQKEELLSMLVSMWNP
jgi:hypothetical protein